MSVRPRLSEIVKTFVGTSEGLVARQGPLEGGLGAVEGPGGEVVPGPRTPMSITLSGENQCLKETTISLAD